MLNIRVKEARIKYSEDDEEESPKLTVFGLNKKNKPVISEVRLDEIGTDDDRKAFNRILLEALYKVTKG